jgi:hypothetical protein
MKHLLQSLPAVGVVLLALTPLASVAQQTEVSGQVRSYWNERLAGDTGPIALANRWQSGTVAVAAASAATVQAELRANATWGGMTLTTTATAQIQQVPGGNADTQSWFNEAYASGSAFGWQWSAGKKVVSWDVGYAFRPNDMVQQEMRRALVSEAVVGRPVLLAETFNADTAWSLVWANPTQTPSNNGSQEAALAARVYHRAGNVDWHGFARHGERTGTSVGVAAAWVASDALELHASARTYEHMAVTRITASNSALTTSTPWQPTLSHAGQQVLVGGTWTSESQISLLVEAWHDASALSDSQWSDWAARNQALPLWLARGAPVAAVAGNLAWQAHAFGAASNLRQNNVYARLSWQLERWQVAADVLYTPSDQGTISTFSLGWTGERFKLDMGLRSHGGPESALVRQLPVQRQAYAVGTWTF